MSSGETVPPGYYADTAPVVSDWADMVSFSPSIYAKPTSIDELKAFLNAALQRPDPPSGIRILGGLHSCSDIYDSEIVIDTTALPKEIAFDPDNGGVVATANWHLREFLYQASLRNKSIAATGGTDAQTLAGLISTNTACASATHDVYETLEWVEYLTLSDDGRSVVERRVASGDADFTAVVCSLGAIGFLTRVRFGLIDQPFFATVQKVVPLADVLTDLDKTSSLYDFWRIDWIPMTESGLLWAATRIPADKSSPDGDYAIDQTETVMKFLMGFVEKLTDNGPYLNWVLMDIYRLMMGVYGVVEANGPLRNMLPVDRRAPVHCAMAEWSFDPADLQQVLASCREYYSVAKWPNLPIEIELTRTDGNLMSPWNWEGLPYIVKFNFMYLTDFLSDQEKSEVRDHLEGLWNHFRKAGIRFKAHWGKLNFLDQDYVREHYQLDRFEPQVQPLFLNAYLRERLGPGASPAAGAG